MGETFTDDLKVQMGRLWSKATQEASDSATIPSMKADPKTLRGWHTGATS